MVVLDADEVVSEDGSEHELIAVEESAASVHFVMLPHAQVGVPELTLTDMWPGELAVALLYAVYETASVLAAIFVDHMSFPSLLVERPVTRIPALFQRVDIDSESMAHGLEFVFEFLRHQRKILHNHKLLC